MAVPYTNPMNPMSPKAQKRQYRRAFVGRLVPKGENFVFQCLPCRTTIQPHRCQGTPDGPPGRECRCALCWRQVALEEFARYRQGNNSAMIRAWGTCLWAIAVQAELKARSMRVTRQMRVPGKGRCARCGAPVEIRRRLARGDHGPFCSPRCKAAAWRERRKAAAAAVELPHLGDDDRRGADRDDDRRDGAEHRVRHRVERVDHLHPAPDGMLTRRLRDQAAARAAEPVADRSDRSGWTGISPEPYDRAGAVSEPSPAASAPASSASAGAPPAPDEDPSVPEFWRRRAAAYGGRYPLL